MLQTSSLDVVVCDPPKNSIVKIRAAEAAAKPLVDTIFHEAQPKSSVRTVVIEAALKWLQEHNPDYDTVDGNQVQQ
jgi:hypothetical protein